MEVQGRLNLLDPFGVKGSPSIGFAIEEHTMSRLGPSRRLKPQKNKSQHHMLSESTSSFNETNKTEI